jgi:hypothetical protein
MIYIYKYKIDQIPQSLLNIYIYLCYERGNEDKYCVYVYVFCAVLCLCFVLSSVYVFCAVLCQCVFIFLCIVLLKRMLHLFLKLVYWLWRFNNQDGDHGWGLVSRFNPSSFWACPTTRPEILSVYGVVFLVFNDLFIDRTYQKAHVRH